MFWRVFVQKRRFSGDASMVFLCEYERWKAPSSVRCECAQNRRETGLHDAHRTVEEGMKHRVWARCSGYPALESRTRARWMVGGPGRGGSPECGYSAISYSGDLTGTSGRLARDLTSWPWWATQQVTVDVQPRGCTDRGVGNAHHAHHHLRHSRTFDPRARCMGFPPSWTPRNRVGHGT